METLYLSGEADLYRDDSTVLVKTNGKKHRFPIETLRHIVLSTDGMVSTKFLAMCGKLGVRVSIFDFYGWYKGSFEPVEASPSGEVTIRQARLIADDVARMTVAKEIVRSAIDNSIANLSYYSYRGNRRLDTAISFMRSQRDSVHGLHSVPELMGCEGIARRTYLEAWPLIDERLSFGTRVKRPPNNPINCLISFLNGMTYAAVRHEIAKTHLNETLSFLHAPSSARSSLSLDLAEPFKPCLTDRIIFKAIKKQMLADNWFDQKEGACLLTDVGRKQVIEMFCAMSDSHKDDERSLRSEMRKEAIRLERHVLGTEPYHSFRRRV